MPYPEDSFLHLSGIKQFLTCRRLWALVHLEQQQSDMLYDNVNRRQLMKWMREHYNAADHDVFAEHNMLIHSYQLGITGVCEAVVFRRSDSGVILNRHEGLWLPNPIMLKNQLQDMDWKDELQLCAQAICLEEMLCCRIDEVYFFESRGSRMISIPVSDEKRKNLEAAYAEMHQLSRQNYIPKVKMKSRCVDCLLQDNCSAELRPNRSVTVYIQEALKESDECENY